MEGPADARVPAAALACGLALALPFWVGRFVPLLDLPQHLALATVIHHHGAPEWGLERYFEVQWGELTPYWLTYLALHALAFAMPVETAARVCLSLYAFAFPWAGIALCRAFGRPAWLGLLAAPLALNTNLYYGFVNYCAGIVLLLFALAALERQLHEYRHGRAAWLAAVTVAVFFAHVQVLAFLLLAAALLALGHHPGWKRSLGALFPLAPATLGLFVPWTYRTFVNPSGYERQFASIRGDSAATFAPFSANLAELPAAVNGAFQDRSDLWLLFGWVLLVGVGTAVRGQEDRPHRLRHPAVLAAAALACYFLTPVSIRGQWNINPRFAILAALLVIPLVSAPPRRARPFGAAAVALTVAAAANAAWHHRAFDREVGPVEQALDAIPRGRRVLPLVYDPRGRVLEKWPYLQFGQYYTVRRGGVVAGSFAGSAPMPVRYLDRSAFPHPSVWRPEDFDYDLHGQFYDYFIVRRGPGSKPIAFETTAGSRVEWVETAGPWGVYRRIAPPGAAAP